MFDGATVGGVRADQIGVVHATAYRPQMDALGLKIYTTFDAVGGLDQSPQKFQFRNTIHASLNGPVSSHMQGNWDDMQYVVVSPFEHVIEENGVPAGFCTVDTFWAFDEATPLTVSKYTLIEPDGGHLEEGEFYRHEGNSIYYRTSLTDESRLAFLRDFLPEHTDVEYGKDRKLEAYSDFAWDLKNSKAYEAIPDDLYVNDEADMERLEELLLSFEGDDRVKVDAAIITAIRKEAVYQALDAYDCPRQTCGKDYWVGGKTSDGSNEFAERLGTKYTSHHYSAQGKLEQMMNGSGLFGIYELASPDEVEAFLQENAGDLTPQTIALARDVISSDLYAQATIARKALLDRHGKLGHNSGLSHKDY